MRSTPLIRMDEFFKVSSWRRICLVCIGFIVAVFFCKRVIFPIKNDISYASLISMVEKQNELYLKDGENYFTFSVFQGGEGRQFPMEKYTSGLKHNLKLIKEVFKGTWKMVLYYQEDMQLDFLEIEDDLLIKIPMRKFQSSWEALFWRFFVASDKRNITWSIRDVDSRINIDERNILNDWLAMNLTDYYLIRSHPLHLFSGSILAGMWGGRKHIENFLYDICYWFRHCKLDRDSDQDFLRNQMHQKLKEKMTSYNYRDVATHKQMKNCKEAYCNNIEQNVNQKQWIGSNFYGPNDTLDCSSNNHCIEIVRKP
jgi:hypothetical protein